MSRKNKNRILKENLLINGGIAAQKALDLESPVYVCPMCMKEKPNSDELTLEHVPQKSLGGKILCLTCQTCNSKAGSRYEGMMPYEPQSERLIGKIPIRGSLGPQNSLLRGMWSIDAKGVLNFKVIAEMNDPRKLAAAEKNRESMQEGSVLHASWKMKYSQEKVNVGHLKNAYLAVFAHFGYETVMKKSYELVRRQIKYPSSRILNNYRFYCTDEHPLDKGIVLTRSPIRAIVCKWGNISVFLPAPDDEHADIYKWIDSNIDIEGTLNFVVENGYEWPKKACFISDISETGV